MPILWSHNGSWLCAATLHRLRWLSEQCPGDSKVKRWCQCKQNQRMDTVCRGKLFQAKDNKFMNFGLLVICIWRVVQFYSFGLQKSISLVSSSCEVSIEYWYFDCVHQGFMLFFVNRWPMLVGAVMNLVTVRRLTHARPWHDQMCARPMSHVAVAIWAPLWGSHVFFVWWVLFLCVALTFALTLFLTFGSYLPSIVSLTHLMVDLLFSMLLVFWCCCVVRLSRRGVVQWCLNWSVLCQSNCWCCSLDFVRNCWVFMLGEENVWCDELPFQLMTIQSVCHLIQTYGWWWFHSSIKACKGSWCGIGFTTNTTTIYTIFHSCDSQAGCLARCFREAIVCHSEFKDCHSEFKDWFKEAVTKISGPEDCSGVIVGWAYESRGCWAYDLSPAHSRRHNRWCRGVGLKLSSSA